MGIKATVVYDVSNHSTLVLRTHSTTTDRFDVLDTIASFSQHCESLRGIARSVTDVSAAWGGPPYVTYNVIHQRFRAIVIWDEALSEFDLAYDVHHALKRLENSIASVGDALERRETAALEKVYVEAGYALRGDGPIALPDAEPKKTSSRPKLLQVPTARRSSAAEPRKKKSGRLLTRLSSAIKSVGSDELGKKKTSPESAATSLRQPSSGAALSVTQFGSDTPFDDDLGELDLPDEVFAWADFGELPPGMGDLNWFTALLKGEEEVRRRPRPPTVKVGSKDSSSISGNAGAANDTSSGTPAGPASISAPVAGSLSLKADRQTGAPGGVTVLDGSGSATPLTAPTLNGVPASVQSSISATPVPSTPGSTQQSATPEQMQASRTSTAQSAGSTPISLGTGQMIGMRSTSQSARSTPQSVASLQQTIMNPGVSPSIPSVGGSQASQQSRMSGAPGSAAQSPGMSGSLPPLPSSASSMASPGVGAAGHGQAMQLQQQVLQRQQEMARQQQAQAQAQAGFRQRMASGAGTAGMAQQQELREPGALSGKPSDLQDMPTRRPAATARSNVPPALIAQQNADNAFDVSALGGLKNTEISGGQETREEVDDNIRTSMNQFAVTMQGGNFVEALQQVNATLKYLATVNPRRDREIMTCSNYVLAQKILIRNSALENELSRIPGGTPAAVQRHVESALMTMFLAEMKHLLPRHRVAAMQVAVEKNSIVGNYGMCARWLRHLLEKAPARQKEDFQRRLDLCVRNGERNSHMPPTNRLCYATLQIVGAPYGMCGVCGAVFHPVMAGVVEGQVCGICHVGAIERKVS